MTDSVSLSTVKLESFSITPAEVVSGASPSAQGVIVLSSPVNTRVDVDLSADTPALVYVPLTVSIPAGDRSGSFDIDTALANEPTSATITATLGEASRQAKLVVYPRTGDPSSNGSIADLAPAAPSVSSALVPAPQPTPTTIDVGALGPPKASLTPPAAWMPLCQPSFAACLLSILPTLPFVAMLSIVAIGLSSPSQPVLQLVAQLKSEPVLGGIGVALVLGLIAAVLLRFVFRGLSAETTNPGVFGELLQRIADLDARLAAFVANNSDAQLEPAFVQAHVVRNLIGEQLEKPGTQWLLGIGYINMWRQVHRAEEALLECDSNARVIAAAVYDELRLTGSDIDQSAELLAKLRLATAQIDPSAAAFVQAPGVTPSPAAAAVTTDGDSARAALRQVRQAINTFRDDNWAGLVHSRNQLVLLLSACGLATLFLLAIAMMVRPTDSGLTSPSDPLLSAAVFYLVGATIGILNRLFADTSTATSVEDYGLTLSRLLITPVLAGLAGLGGVLAVALLLSGVGGVQPTSTAAVRSIPTLTQIFNLEQNVFGIVIAAVFGLTPHLLVSTLQGQADKLAQAITSTNAQTNESQNH